MLRCMLQVVALLRQYQDITSRPVAHTRYNSSRKRRQLKQPAAIGVAGKDPPKTQERPALCERAFRLRSPLREPTPTLATPMTIAACCRVENSFSLIVENTYNSDMCSATGRLPYALPLKLRKVALLHHRFHRHASANNDKWNAND